MLNSSTYPERDVHRKRAIIFANGKLGDLTAVRELLYPGDLIIAADGGSRHCLELGIQPHLVVGDLDSLDERTLEHFEQQGVEVLRYPERKDFTDLELALIQAQQRGFREVLVLAALGNRWDQTVANLLLPAEESFANLHIRLIDGSQEIQLLRAGQEKKLHGKLGDTVSLIPLGGDAHGITTQGLEYPLKDETLYLGSTRGVSNVLVDDPARVMLLEGLLMIVVIHKEV